MNFQLISNEFIKALKNAYKCPIDEQIARKVVRTVLADFVAESYPLLYDHLAITPINKIRKISGYSQMIESLAEMDSVSAAYMLSSYYSLLICQNRRVRDGIYFTPPSLSTCLFDDISAAYSQDITKAKIIDPSSGGGALLSPFASQIRSGMKDRKIQPLHRLNQISANFVGIELCRTLSEMSKVFTLIELYQDIEWTGYIPTLQIQTTNFLTKRFERHSFDVVLGNPPFRRLIASEKGQYSTRFNLSANGGSNLYGMFIHKSLSLVRPGGIVSLVIPASLFAGARYAELRSYISRKADVHSVQTIHNRDGVFIGVQQEVALLTLKKRMEGAKKRTYFSVGLVCDDVKSTPIGRCKLPKEHLPWIIPRSKDQAAAVDLFSKNLNTLADYGISVRTGSVVWNRDSRLRYPTRGSKSQNGKATRYPLIWSDCIGVDGTFSFERAKLRAPNEVFVSTKSVDRDLIRSTGIVLKRISNSKQNRRIYCAVVDDKFISNYGAYLCENHVNFLAPTENYSCPDLSLLAQVLNSEPIDEAFRCMSGTTAISKYELSKLPLPDIDDVQQLIKDGLEIDDAVKMALYK